MRERTRIGLAGLLVGAAGLWRLVGIQGEVVARLGPLPDLMSDDIVTIPLAVAGLTVLAGRRDVSGRRKALGVGAILGAVLWVTSEWPWDDPLIPGLGWGRHGIHVLDLLAVIPAAIGGRLLLVRSARNGSSWAGHPA